jgi:fructokinase
MRRVFTIGETGLDIIFKDSVPLAAKAGGSMLNVSVTLGRLNVPVNFISEFGTDHVGDIIEEFLSKNGVNTQYSNRFKDGKSAVALAFLDENQNAEYSFYKAYPEKRFKVSIPPINKDDIVLFGSYFGISSDIRETLLDILYAAKSNGALIIYDPNFRKAHLHQLKELLPFIKLNFQLADIIKGSNEDFEIIFNKQTPSDAFDAIFDPSKILVYTKGKDGASLVSENNEIHVPGKHLNSVSTVGAGDNFNAGIAYGLLEQKIEKKNLGSTSKETWERILNHGVNFASEVCMSLDNYISEEYAKSYINK